jgi:hypothetical protein
MEERLTTRYICLAWKLGLHPSTFAHLSSITSNLEKWAPNKGALACILGGGVTRRARPEGRQQVPSRHPPPTGNSSRYRHCRVEAGVYLKNCRRGGDTGIIVPLSPPPYMWFGRKWGYFANDGYSCCHFMNYSRGHFMNYSPVTS